MLGGLGKRARQLPKDPGEALVLPRCTRVADLNFDRKLLPRYLRGSGELTVRFRAIGLVFKLKLETSAYHGGRDYDLVESTKDLDWIGRPQPLQKAQTNFHVVPQQVQTITQPHYSAGCPRHRSRCWLSWNGD